MSIPTHAPPTKYLRRTYLANGEEIRAETRVTKWHYFPGPIFALLVVGILDYATAAARYPGLPAFPGLDAQHQALEHGAKIAGCTVHFVDEGVDSGPIVVQAAVPVLDEDTADSLSARILKEEHRLYAEAIALVLSGAYRLEGRRVIRNTY